LHLKETLQKVITKDCSIQVFGLGYVGFPLGIRLAKSGFKVIGVDTDFHKIEEMQNKSISITMDMKTEFIDLIQNGNFVPSVRPLVSNLPRVGIICVPTPVPHEKRDSNVYVISAVEKFLNTSKSGDLIILESSVKAGTTDEIIKIVNSRGYVIGEDFGVCFCPERIDPLNQKWKLENIPRIIFSSDDVTHKIAQRIYESVNNSNLFRVNSPKIAEVVKSFENAFRLVNISLVNELAVLCDRLQINVNDVIDAASTKPFGFMSFNSGAGAGGHCIPKDPQLLLDLAKQHSIPFSSIQNAIEINSMIPKYIVASIENVLNEFQLGRSVLVCGLTYKANIEDMRDSPGFKILNELSNKNIVTAGYDPHFKHELLSKYMIENHLEKFDFKILSSLDSEIKDYDCICVVQNHTKTKQRIEEIYKKSLIPMIYDCQNKISYDPKSKTILKGLGLGTHNKKFLKTRVYSQSNLKNSTRSDKMSIYEARS